MKRNTILGFVLFILFSCTNHKNEIKNVTPNKVTKSEHKKTTEPENISKLVKSEIEPYDFDTILKNGYHLSYRVYKDNVEGDSLQSLTLVKGNRDIKTLSETSYPMLHKNLGHIAADFGDSFLFVQSYGSGNPDEMQLIKKENGISLKEGVIVDLKEDQKVLLYIENLHEANEELRLLDLKNNTEKLITDFNNLSCTNAGGLRNCVKIDTVTQKEIVIKTDSEEDHILKRYTR
ncbi:hypothetical protein C8C83_5528 [Flavobacterium sp. 90]|uniref:hypothetical protein n=1 Tax=unclassified Flavobacterium TaxID=196869 RepID=UPI000EB500A2|nr:MULTISPECIES: hypothetical protein [unclassified Flavobacterium]RKR08291.1 hypothetical protein C8C82_0158 [Flavobacterium sp. 81]TCK57479.1 hypothetical protein C8C83_5528 [Flavobacterium sp. 90]